MSSLTDLRNKAAETNALPALQGWLNRVHANTWKLDEVLLANENLFFYYLPDRKIFDSGIYAQVGLDGKLELGSYEDAVQVITDGIFTPMLTLQFTAEPERTHADLRYDALDMLFRATNELVDDKAASETERIAQILRNIESSPIATDDYLTAAAAAVRMYGWVASKAETGTPTWFRALEIFYAQENQITADDITKADDARRSLTGQLSDADWDNDYLRKLYQTLIQPKLSRRDLGLAASAIITYNRKLQEEQDRKQGASSQWVGKPGEKKHTFGHLILTGIKRGIETAFGLTNLYKFQDENGNRISWFSSHELPEDTKHFQLVGDVKDHGEYRGMKETRIGGRVKVQPLTICPQCGGNGKACTCIQVGEAVDPEMSEFDIELEG